MPKASRRRQVASSYFRRAACTLIGSLILGQGAMAQSAARLESATASSVETIYVVRSLRSERTSPGEACVKAGPNFQPLSEDHYTLRSVAVEMTEGRITNADVSKVGDLRTCNGKTDRPDTYGFSGEGHLAGLAFEGSGECLQAYANFPETGLSVFRCFLKLSGLPPEYAGGMLTTNTVGSKTNAGPQSDPPGYLQLSIATIRIWHRRDK